MQVKYKTRWANNNAWLFFNSCYDTPWSVHVLFKHANCWLNIIVFWFIFTISPSLTNLSSFQVCQVLTKFEGVVEYIHISDQFSGPKSQEWVPCLSAANNWVHLLHQHPTVCAVAIRASHIGHGLKPFLASNTTEPFLALKTSCEVQGKTFSVCWQDII